MSSPDQGFLVDKEDGQVPPEDSQVQADENAASDMNFSPLILSDVESGVEEISSSDGEQRRTYAELTPVQPVQHVESDEDLAHTSNDEEDIFAANLPKREFHHAYSSYADLTPLQAVDHVLKPSVTIESGDVFGQGSSNENYQEPIYAELTPMQAIDQVLKPSDIIPNQGTEKLNQHRYK